MAESWQDFISGKSSRGFTNPGIYCYRITAYVTLLHMPKFMAFLQTNYDRLRASHGSESVSVLLAELAKRYWDSFGTQDHADYHQSRAYDMNVAINTHASIARIVEIKDGDWDHERQQDAGEYLLFLLKHITQEVQTLADPTIDAEFAHLLMSNTTEMWMCQHKHDVEGAGHERIMPIDFSIIRNSAGQEALDLSLIEYFVDNFLYQKGARSKDGTNCEQCSQPLERDPIVIKLETAPEYLLIQLNQHKSITQKVFSRVGLPLALDLSGYAADSDLYYRLICTSWHQGSAANEGHYKTVVEAPNTRIYLVNDNNVEQRSKRALTDLWDTDVYITPYIVTYERCSRAVYQVLTGDGNPTDSSPAVHPTPPPPFAGNDPANVSQSSPPNQDTPNSGTFNANQWDSSPFVGYAQTNASSPSSDDWLPPSSSAASAKKRTPVPVRENPQLNASQLGSSTWISSSSSTTSANNQVPSPSLPYRKTSKATTAKQSAPIPLSEAAQEDAETSNSNSANTSQQPEPWATISGRQIFLESDSDDDCPE